MDEQLRHELDTLKLNSKNHTHALYLIASSLEESLKYNMSTCRSLGFDTQVQMATTTLIVVQKLMAQLNQMIIRGD